MRHVHRGFFTRLVDYRATRCRTAIPGA